MTLGSWTVLEMYNKILSKKKITQVLAMRRKQNKVVSPRRLHNQEDLAILMSHFSSGFPCQSTILAAAPQQVYK
jgi:hypothetical protein